MKNLLKFAGTVLVLTLGWMPSAQAILINGTEVGAIDNFECAYASTRSGQAYEESLVLSCLEQEVELVENIETFPTMISDGTNRAIDVSPAEPGIFLLKFGTGNTGNDMFIFTNLADLQFLVWNDAELVDNGLPANHVQSISHYTYGGGTTDMPEPATLSLFGLGLLGLGSAMRRRRKVS